jgi:hypothetical protein
VARKGGTGLSGLFGGGTQGASKAAGERKGGTGLSGLFGGGTQGASKAAGERKGGTGLSGLFGGGSQGTAPRAPADAGQKAKAQAERVRLALSDCRGPAVLYALSDTFC